MVLPCPEIRGAECKLYGRVFLTLVVSVSIASGCATVDGSFFRDSGNVLRTRLTFVDLKFRPIPDGFLDNPEIKRELYPGAAFPDPLILQFGYVVGRIAGPNAPRPFDSLWLKRKYAALERSSQADFSINLDYLERKLGEVAVPYVRRAEDTDFAVRPQETRLAGLLLGVSDPGADGYAAIPMFYDSGAGDLLLLIYVDRPCRISGDIDTAKVDRFVARVPELSGRIGGIFQLQITLSNAGLHWVSLTPAGKGKITLRNVDPMGPIGVIVLENAVALSSREISE